MLIFKDNGVLSNEPPSSPIFTTFTNFTIFTRLTAKLVKMMKVVKLVKIGEKTGSLDMYEITLILYTPKNKRTSIISAP